MKEEALKKGGELLNRIPELKDLTKLNWSEHGTGTNFIALCELLKGNAIPLRELDLGCKALLNERWLLVLQGMNTKQLGNQ